MSGKSNFYIMHSAHLDLFWMGTQETCLEWGTGIINDVVDLAAVNENYYFVIETVRFLEYFLHKHPEKKELLAKLVARGQIEICGDYTDRMENQYDGESLLRNLLYGKKVLKQLLGIDSQITYHPDIPGFAEQMPQILKKSGVVFSLTARGFRLGARFQWKALDKSTVVMYDFPRHYAYYNIETEVLPHLEQIRKNIQSHDVILSCSAGDLGPVNTFSTPINGGNQMVVLTDYVKELNRKYPDLNFKLAGIVESLNKLDKADLRVLSGESPSRWGLNSARDEKLFQMDKTVSAELLQAEKFFTISELLGMPVSIEFDRHPLAHRGYSGGKRKYFDLKFQPRTIGEYIDFGWRLLVITQDHNYGGIEGAQTSFDRLRYQEAALRIAQKIRQSGFENICSCIRAEGDVLVLFNSMNWKRNESVYFESSRLDDKKSWLAKDSGGRVQPVMKSGRGYVFLAEDVPSLGYKTYTIEEGFVESVSYREIKESRTGIRVKNRFYELEISKGTGAITLIRDLSTGVNLVKGTDFLTVNLYEDAGASANENVVNKPLLEESGSNVYKVGLVEDNYLRTMLEVVTELAGAKIGIQIALNHLKKEIRFETIVYWTGVPDVQMKMNLNFNDEFRDIFYGVPYGTQKLGNFIEPDNLDLKKDDEIAEELYRRYREVLQWFALENGKAGISVGSNHSAFDFNGNEVYAVLLRDVKNVGEHDSRYSNEGELHYHFTLSSYNGTYESNSAFKPGFELLNPLVAVEKKQGGIQGSVNLPPENSFIDTDGIGVLTVFKKSETEEGKCITRLFNSTPAEYPLRFGGSLGIKPVEVCDFNENPISDPADKLEAFEIKQVKFIIDKERRTK